MRRTRRVLAFLVSTVLATTALGLVGVTPAEASFEAPNLYSQPNGTASSGPVSRGAQTLGLLVTPTSAAAGTAINVRVFGTTYAINNNTASTLAANTMEVDAVVTINGADYTIRGSQNTVAVAPGQALFRTGWIANSTAGSSSATSVGAIAGTGGIGATIRGNEGTPVSIVAPAVGGTYTIGLKAIIANRVSGGGTAVLTDLNDEITNTDSTNAGGAPGTVGPGGPTGSFALNTGNGLTNTNGNIVFSTPVTFVSIGPTINFVASTGQAGGVAAIRPPVSTWPSPTVATTLTGANWNALGSVGSFTVSYCDAAGTNCSSPPPASIGTLTNSLTTDASGNMTGMVTASRVGCTTGCGSTLLVPGNRTIRLIQGAKIAFISVLVLSDPTISISPTSGPQGTVVSVSGTNFNPSLPANVSGLLSACPGACTLSSDGAPVVAVSATGAVGPVNFTLNDLRTVSIGVYQGGPGTPSAGVTQQFAGFTVDAHKCAVGDGPINTPSCNTRQHAYATVLAGELSQQAVATAGNPNATTVVMCAVAAPPADPGGTPPGNTSTCGALVGTAANQMFGTLNTITVKDTRGGALGWSLTATMPDLSAGSNSIAKSRMSITPTCTAFTAGSAPGAAGGGSQTFAGTVNLCTKDAQVGAGQSTSGIWTVAAPLTLNVSAFQASGSYTSIVTINLA